MPMFDPKVLPLTGQSPSVQAKIGIRCSSLSFVSGTKSILSNVSATFPKNGVSVIMGPNGAGKSVLLRTIIGLLKPTSGFVQLDADFAGHTAMVFQRPVLIRRTVQGNLAHALAIARYPRNKRKNRMAELIAISGLKGLEKTPARQLSGGEQQRLQMVRALASGPKLILLDEPSASLDPQSTFAIEQIIKTVSENKTKIILVTHDTGQAKRLAHDVTFIHKGRLIEQNDAYDYFNSPKSPLVKSYLEGELLV